ncbi:hypothetical protein T492DRAFT_442988 [Pavlovales sp. CCMP2436]|nr:hypothetical protein T492DRAFT_442988 [Pavlovales sp. CCMP2436]
MTGALLALGVACFYMHTRSTGYGLGAAQLARPAWLPATQLFIGDGSARPHDRLCGSDTSPAAWIDIEVFWINLNTDIDRASAMRAQLAVALVDGACATRVPAVTISDVAGVHLGGLKWLETGITSPSLSSELEVAFSVSHLRALYWGHRSLRSSSHCFLVLEDDIDMLSFPRAQFSPERRHAYFASSLAAVVGSSGRSWSFGLLNLIALKAHWVTMRKLWVGQPIAFNRLQLNKPTHAHCPAPIFGSGGYLASARGATTALRTWDVRHISHAQALTVDVSRVCWAQPHPRGGQCPHMAPVRRLTPDLRADTCLMHLDAFGPALNASEVLSSPTAYDEQREAFLSRAEEEMGYFLYPPPLIQSAGPMQVNMSHPGRIHEWSRFSARKSWGITVSGYERDLAHVLARTAAKWHPRELELHDPLDTQSPPYAPALSMPV